MCFGRERSGFLEIWTRVWHVPVYLFPGPVVIAETIARDWQVLFPSLMFTLKVTIVAFLAAAAGGLLLSILFASSRWIERTLFPYAIVLQVTQRWRWLADHHLGSGYTARAVHLCMADRVFPDSLQYYHGSEQCRSEPCQPVSAVRRVSLASMLWLRLPSALPYFLAGLRISGGLALIGAVVAEFVAGAGGTQSGLAYRILESVIV